MALWQWIAHEAVQYRFLVKLIAMSVGVGVAFILFGEFFRLRKIQPKGFRWRTLRNEAVFATINLSLSGFLLGSLTALAQKYGLAAINGTHAAWWQAALEYALYFAAFDTWFYWFHRAMHRGVFYRLVHKVHHLSTSPNLLTTFSVSPLESLVNGGFVPIFLAIVPVHAATLALIVPTNIIMGLYVHSGYEFFPRWWNKTWVTKWFITATFHDQHHKYFRYNFGGYTTIWDRICGTVRSNFDSDFEKIKDRVIPAPSFCPAKGEQLTTSGQAGAATLPR